MQKTSKFALLMISALMSYSMVSINHVYAAENVPFVVLNSDAPRDLVVRVFPDISKFDPKTKQIDFDIQWAIDDNKSTKPFQAWVSTNAYGRYDFNEKANSGGFYEVWEKPHWGHHPIAPTYFLNFWPFESHVVDIFLLIDDNVSIQTDSPIKVPKTGDMAEDVEWNININAKDISQYEKDAILTTTNYHESESVSIFKYELTISRTPDYIFQNLMFVLIPLVPLSIIILHLKFFKNRQLNTNLRIFSIGGGSLLSVYVGMKSLIPAGFTMVEVISSVGLVLSVILCYNIIRNKKRKEKSLTQKRLN